MQFQDKDRNISRLKKKSIMMAVALTCSVSLFVFAGSRIHAAESEIVFPYNNPDLYVADCLIKGYIDSGGNVVQDTLPIFYNALMHDYFWQDCVEQLIEQPLVTVDSVIWKNAKEILGGDFITLGNWERYLYEMVLMDYLAYSEQDDSYNSNLMTKVNKYADSVYSEVVGYYADKLEEGVSTLSGKEKEVFLKKYGYIDKLDVLHTYVSTMINVVDSLQMFCKNLSSAMAIQEAEHHKMVFLRRAAVNARDDLFFQEAVEDIEDKRQSSLMLISLGEGVDTMAKFATTSSWNLLLLDFKTAGKKFASSLAAITLGRDFLDVLFNSDDISENNIKLLILYVIHSYMTDSVRDMRDNYILSPTEENAKAMNNSFFQYVIFQKYATAWFREFAYSVSSADNYQKLIDDDLRFCDMLLSIYLKYYDNYDAHKDADDAGAYEQSQETGQSKTDSEESSIISEQQLYIHKGREYYEWRGHLYSVYPQSMEWSEAESFCEDLSGHLLVINSLEEQLFINHLIADKECNLYWIGLLLNENDSWEWINGDDLYYSNWAKGEPNKDFGGRENVGELYGRDQSEFKAGEWNDSLESGGTLDFWRLDHTGFICEWE